MSRTLVGAAASVILTGLLFTVPAGAGTLSVLYQANAEDGGSSVSFSKPLPVAGGAVIVEVQSGLVSSEEFILLLTPKGKDEQYGRTVLHNFTAPCSADGTGPSGRLVADKAGNAWGMTNASCGAPGGTVFELVKPATAGKWAYRRVLRLPASFFQNTAGGGYDDMVFDSAGNLYGLLRRGGDNTTCPSTGCGTLFEIPAATLAGGTAPVKTLYTFPRTPGGVPAGLVRDSHGNLFGTLYEGGSAGRGAVWEVSPPAGKLTRWTGALIHDFCAAPDKYRDCPDGIYPTGAPAVASNGVLYGTSSQSGAGPGQGEGVIWSMQPPATAEGRWKLLPIHTLYGAGNAIGPDTYIQAPIDDTLLSAKGEIITLVEYGGAVGKPATEVGGGGVLGVIPKTGADGIISNAFAAYGVQSGPQTLTSGLGVDSSGNLYGSAQNYYNKNPKIGTSPAVIFEVTP